MAVDVTSSTCQGWDWSVLKWVATLTIKFSKQGLCCNWYRNKDFIWRWAPHRNVVHPWTTRVWTAPLTCGFFSNQMRIKKTVSLGCRSCAYAKSALARCRFLRADCQIWVCMRFGILGGPETTTLRILRDDYIWLVKSWEVSRLSCQLGMSVVCTPEVTPAQ